MWLQGHLDLLQHVMGEGIQQLHQNREDLTDKAKLSSRGDLVIAKENALNTARYCLVQGRRKCWTSWGEGWEGKVADEHYCSTCVCNQAGVTSLNMNCQTS